MTERILRSMLLVLACALPGLAEDGARNWPSFRGPHASGIADGPAIPTEWDVGSRANIKWRTEIPGLGYSCPVIWGDKVFLTTAVGKESEPRVKVGLYGNVRPVEDESEQSWRVLCLDKRTGKILWSKTAHEGVAQVKRHPKSSHANSTPATDGKHLVAFFGSEGLYCYDLDGKLLWKKDLGKLDAAWYVDATAQWGFASSPIIYKDRVIVQCDVLNDAFLAAFDIKDGRQIWRKPRDDVPTWSTPTIHESAARTQLIVNGYRHIGGYDPQTGKELWRLSGGGDIPVPTPVVANDLIYITSNHRPQQPIFFIKIDATGDISLADGATANDSIVWSRRNRGNYMQTPLVVGDYLYCCADNGVLTCYDAKNGKTIYRKRLGRGGRLGFTASGVAANGKLYFTSEEGEIYVVRAGPEFELLATNSMNAVCMATPAIADGILFVRTQHHLYAIAE